MFDCGVERKGGIGRIVGVGKNFKLAVVKEKAIVHGCRIDPIGKRLRSLDQKIITIVIEELNLGEQQKIIKKTIKFECFLESSYAMYAITHSSSMESPTSMSPRK